MKKLILITFCYLIMISPLHAQLEGMDLSNLGNLQEKLGEAAQNDFQNMDMDGSGEISLEEYTEFMIEDARKKAESSFNQIDMDGTGGISKEEYAQFMSFASSKMSEFVKQIQQNQR